MRRRRGLFGNRESGIGNRESGIGNRESGIGNRDSGFGIRDSSGKHSAQLRALPVPRHGAAEMSGWLSPAAAPRSPRAAHPACQAGRTAGRNR
ncbi:hypothetical protein DGN07_16345 [Xanthomonas citri pv. fuscans]|nr:hypothetical protein DGN07_16345 [Xanthomonas citri pv. fuscans]